jgi:CMP-N,N'-diacetyllegionaminic acid synthase
MDLTTKNILAIIPARGGSKTLPRKNIIDLAGKPLISWTITASIESKYITKTIVSSDDDEILDISRSFGAETIKRSSELALDTSSSEVVIEHVLEEVAKDITMIFDLIVLLQPTSPLRSSYDIDMALENMFSKNATALISVCQIDNKILKTFVENEEGYIEGAFNNKYPFKRRQDLPSVYMPNGAIYIIVKDEFDAGKTLFTNKTALYEMEKIKSIDIDNINDLEAAERFFT